MSPATAVLVRTEYGLALLVCAGAFVANLGEVRWPVAIALFAWIDLVGYLPGAVAYRRSRGGPIHRGYYIAYNFGHSLTTNGLVALLWTWNFGFEWALLALPIHLFGDRALFGNFLKSFHLDFEPRTHPAYARLRRDLEVTPPVAARGRSHREPSPLARA